MKKEEVDKIEKKQDSNLIFNLVVILCIFLFSIAISPKSLQNDTFYTIKIGEFIMNNGISNLTEDNFSWHELPYTYPHWLYDFGMYCIYSIMGQKRCIFFYNNIYSIIRWNNLSIK